MLWKDILHRTFSRRAYSVFSVCSVSQYFWQWLHGPEAEGRCPNCENACSLAGGTLSLASPSELSSSRARRYNLAQNQAIHSPSTPVQLHLNDTLMNSRDESHPQVTLTNSTSSSSTSSHSSTIDYSETTVSAEESKMIDEQHHIHHPFQNEEHLTNSFRLPWGVVSRLISILVFLMFLYKLRSWERLDLLCSFHIQDSLLTMVFIVIMVPYLYLIVTWKCKIGLFPLFRLSRPMRMSGLRARSKLRDRPSRVERQFGWSDPNKDISLAD